MSALKDTGERLIPEGNTKTLTYGEHLARYSSTTELVKNKVVLDIASGAGYGTKLISKYASKVFGVDYSEEAIKYAKEHYSNNNITYKVGDAQELPITDNSVDVVVSLETIEHLKDPKKFIKEVKRVLNDEGSFIVSTPNDDEFTEGNTFHLHEFDLDELKKLIKSNFKYYKFYYQGTYFASALLSEKKFTNAENWSGDIYKTFGQEKSKAIYFLALASDKPIGELKDAVCIGDSWNSKDSIEQSMAIQKTLDDSQQQIKNLSSELLRTQQNSATLEHEIKLIHESRTWKLMKKTHKLKQKISKKK